MILFKRIPYHKKENDYVKTEFHCDPEQSRTTDGNKFRIL